MDSDIKVKFDPKTKKGTVKGSKFSAEIAVLEQKAGSEVAVSVDLPLLLTPFKGKVQEMIEKKLAKFLS